MSIDNRAYKRFPFNHHAQCAFLESFPETFAIDIVDINPEGIGFICDDNLDNGTNVYVVIDLGRGESVRFIAKVRWTGRVPNSTRYRVGAKILDTSKENLETFIRFYFRFLIPGNERQKKILIMEQNKTLNKQLQGELARLGYDAVCAFEGEDGFHQYLIERPDLVILDFALPKLNGYEVCRKIRKLQNDQDTLILMLINKKKDIDPAVGNEVGVQKYFVKPVKLEKFLADVNTVLSLPKD